MCAVDFEFVIRNKSDLFIMTNLFQDDVFRLLNTYYKQEYYMVDDLCKDLHISPKLLPKIPNEIIYKLEFDDSLSVVENALIYKTLQRLKKLMLDGSYSKRLKNVNIDTLNVFQKAFSLNNVFCAQCSFIPMGSVMDLFTDLLKSDDYRKEFMKLPKSIRENSYYRSIFKYQWCLKNYDKLKDKDFCKQYVYNCFSAQNFIPVPMGMMSGQARIDFHTLLKSVKCCKFDFIQKFGDFFKSHRIGMGFKDFLKETNLEVFYNDCDLSKMSLEDFNELLNKRSDLILEKLNAQYS